jgi:lipopolysaccharide biosynthesis glycosyltransferase
MLQPLRTFARYFLSSCGHALGTLVASLSRRPGLEKLKNCDVSVHLLVSSKTWHAGILAAISFEFFTGRRWNLFIHEDGSVDQKAHRRMERILPGIRFVSRKEAEEQVREALSNYPTCWAHRAKHNLFLKFFDVPIFAPGKRFIFLDSDVLFFQKPEKILAWADADDEEFFYNEDTKEKYCIPRQEIQKEFKIELWPRFNSGLMLVPKKALSLELAEQFLGTFEMTAHHPQFFEQTLYALMASVWNRGGPLPHSYEISWGFFRDKKSIARHYVGAFKHDILYLEGPLTLFWKMFLVLK